MKLPLDADQHEYMTCNMIGVLGLTRVNSNH